MKTDVQALRNLAQAWRDVSYRCRYEHDRVLRDEDPGPHMTAIQLEWAARKIEELRDELYARNCAMSFMLGRLQNETFLRAPLDKPEAPAHCQDSETRT